MNKKNIKIFLLCLLYLCVYQNHCNFSNVFAKLSVHAKSIFTKQHSMKAVVFNIVHVGFIVM